MSLRDNYHRNAGQRLPRSIQARFKETARTVLRFVDNNRNMLNAVGGFTALAAVGTAFIGVATYFGDQSDRLVRANLDEGKNPIVLQCKAGPHGEPADVRQNQISRLFPLAERKKITAPELAKLIPQRNPQFISCRIPQPDPLPR